MEDNEAEAAQAFIEARRHRPAWPGVDLALRPRTIAEGYRLQDAIHRRLGGRVGYKVGATSAAGQRVWGVAEPAYAGLFAADRSANLAEAFARPLRAPGLECEIALVLAADLSSDDLSEAAVQKAIGGCAIACEIIDSRYDNPKEIGVPTLIADDFFQAGFVLGAANLNWRQQDLRQARASITVDGRKTEGAATDVLDAYASVTWLVRQLGHLAAGEIVLTGAIVGPLPVTLPAREMEFAITGFAPLRLTRP
jgi:2-keto-4-pentenoate hydratase